MRKIAKMFRQHQVAPTDVVSPLYRQLTQEWADLHALPSTSRQVARWARAEPRLSGYPSPGAIVDAVDAADARGTDELLLALIRLFQSGQQLAGRIVLQCFLPKLCRTSTHATTLCTSTEDTWAEDRRHITIAEFWAVMADYPASRRTASVAPNLVLDTLHRVSGARTPPRPEPVDPEELATSQLIGLAADNPPRVALDGLTADADLLEVIHWGLTSDVLSREDAQLLVAAYLPEKRRGFGFDDAAQQLGLTPAAVRQRSSRAARRLAQAVREELRFSPDDSRSVTRAAA